MMKKNHAARLGALALALTLVSTCLMGGTLAKYTTTVTGTATATVAKWSFKANGETATIANLSLTPTKYNNVTDNKIAPGTSGFFEIKAKNDSEVGASYTIEFTASNVPKNVSFYQSTNGSLKGDKIEEADGKYTVVSDKSIAIGAPEESTFVMWEWPYGDSKEADQETIATGAYEMSVKITVTGTQATPVQKAGV